MLSFYLSLVKTDEERSKMESLYYEYKKIMKYTALDILKDDGLADDAVHEAFIKIARHLDGVDEVLSHKTKSFVVVIAKNMALDILRKEKRLQAYSFEAVESFYGVENYVLENLEVDQIRLIIESLPDIHRDVIQLKVYHDLPDKEIADILGISNQAVRKRLQRARAALKELLAERGGY